MQCHTAVLLHQEVHSVSSLLCLESGLDHVTFFGQWHISKHHSGRALKRHMHWGLTSLAAGNLLPPGEDAQAAQYKSGMVNHTT